MRNMNPALERCRYAQNMRKRDIVPFLPPAAGKVLQELLPTAEGKVVPWARHLGGRYSRNDSNWSEVRLRKQAMRSGWAQLGKF